MDTTIPIAFYRERIVEKEYSGLGIWETFIFIIPSRNFLFREYSISRSTNKYILSNSFADLSNISFEIQEIEFPQYTRMILTKIRRWVLSWWWWRVIMNPLMSQLSSFHTRANLLGNLPTFISIWMETFRTDTAFIICFWRILKTKVNASTDDSIWGYMGVAKNIKIQSDHEGLAILDHLKSTTGNGCSTATWPILKS